MPTGWQEKVGALPIIDVLANVRAALDAGRPTVLAAPPGAGKTTVVPLACLDAPWRQGGRIILIEPRRLAARAAARRMAALLGESVGDTVGYRMRLDSRISSRTRIEVVTEGVFVRMIVDDPELTGIAAVIFDEFHERALDADFGLALALDVLGALRPDLRLVVMSATLDIGKVAAILPAPETIESTGRSFPVTLSYRERKAGTRIEDAVLAAIREAFANEAGSILAFLPGQAEIRRVATALQEKGFADKSLIAPLYGMMDAADQDRAINPPADGVRKIVLATAIAETSITIDGVRIVIDGGLERLPAFEPATGITRLETVRVSQASANQRAGRAGRTEPGLAIRLWREEQTNALPAFKPPEILACDLSGLLLDCAAWGTPDPNTLSFIDAPPEPALIEARSLLRTLGAVDGQGALTAIGRAMRDIALPPRLAAMVARQTGAARTYAAELALILSEPGLGGRDIDLTERHRRLVSDRGERAKAVKALARRIGSAHVPEGGSEPIASAGALLATAFPDRIARQRGGRGRFIMANGRGAVLDESEPLSGAQYLVVADLTGQAGAQRILSAVTLADDDIARIAAADGVSEDVYGFDDERRAVRARRVSRLGAITLREDPIPSTDPGRLAHALAEGVRQLGIGALPFSKTAQHLRARLGFLHRTLGEPWPDVADAALLETLEEWFSPFHPGATRFSELEPQALEHGLLSRVPFSLRGRLDDEAPTHFQVPTGSRLPIAYDGDVPVLAVRVQELFGLTTHPTVASGSMPLLLELLSPANRPIQTTRDLPGFWAGSWADVRADMRGRYPKHVWPEDPANAAPTNRAKPRKG